MTDYKPGDRVSLEHTDGSRLVNRVVFHPYGLEKAALAVNYAEGVTDSRADFVSVPPPTPWRVTDHKPKIELPLEPGYYEDNYGDVWTQSTKGVWAMISDPYSALKPSEYAPFTRLVPEGSEREAAIREVLDYLAGVTWSPVIRLDGIISAGRNHFGIAE